MAYGMEYQNKACRYSCLKMIVVVETGCIGSVGCACCLSCSTLLIIVNNKIFDFLTADFEFFF